MRDEKGGKRERTEETGQTQLEVQEGLCPELMSLLTFFTSR